MIRKLNLSYDLTLDNIIFSSKKTTIIDWEFTHLVANMLDLTLLTYFYPNFNSFCSSKISEKRYFAIQKLWLILFKENINKKILNNPFYFFQRYIVNDKKLCEAYKISKKILPIYIRQKI